MKDIVILGAQGCAKEICFLLEENNKIEFEWNILGFITEEEGADLPYPVLGNDDWLLKQEKEIYAVCAVGNPALKRKIICKYQSRENIHFPIIVSQHALIGDRNLFGKGTIICSGVTITTEVELGEFVTVNIGSTICHESRIGDFTTLAPGVNISGNDIIGAGCDIGVGAKLIQGIKVGNDSVVGAGSVVIRDVPEAVTVIGCPGRVIK